jgi:L-ascorbate metabolism protein UlaG (beta-lactamase superfamily)
MRVIYSHLEPTHVNLPSSHLLNSWRAQSFEPLACRRILESLLQERPDLRGLLSPDAITRGEVVATNALLFGVFSSIKSWSWIVATAAGKFVCELEDEMVADIAQMLRDASQGDGPIDVDEELPEELSRVLAGGYHKEPPHGQWPTPREPGIYRREHASLLLCSGSTRLLFDPQRNSYDWTTNFQKYPSDVDWSVDGLLLTHIHNDHWSLASILMAMNEETPVIVPPVPRASLLCDVNPGQALAMVNQKYLAPSWGETLQIGDFTIDVLPFYGEQPSATHPTPHPDLRNWGSCYRVQCPAFSALLLVDSGSDPLGAALSVAEMSAKNGPVDVVLSCALGFPEVINDGLPHYILSLPFSYVRETFLAQQRGHVKHMTMGTRGLAEVCEAAKAKYYLPYAHGFSGMHQIPQNEDVVMRALSQELGHIKARTQSVDWLPGDFATFHQGQITIHR